MLRAAIFGLAFTFITSVAAADSDVFMKAIRFALTGSDGADVIVEDRASCVFRIDGKRTYGEDNTPSQEVFHLNNVDPARLTLTEKGTKYPNGAITKYVEVTLAGEDTVYEDRAVWVWKLMNKTMGPTRTTNQASAPR